MIAWDELVLENSYAEFPEHFYHLTEPAGLKGAHLISFNPEVAVAMGIDPCTVTAERLALHFGDGAPLPGGLPLAMKYAGHQFGVFNPQLGDGRGVLLGEWVDAAGKRWDLHLKGAGKTRYSRFGDGRAVLRSSIREYLASAAMTGLRIPTTQALCLIGSEQYTLREGMEPCAQVLRVTECHIRFGHFEHFYYSRQEEDLKRLADYCLARFYPQFVEREQPYLAMFTEIRNRSAALVAQWQAYGFVHGVLNTDNMSILGETFDYGPYTFLDQYTPEFVSNQNDHERRYAFERQPDIVLWNLSCLAQALLPLIPKEALIEALNGFKAEYETAYYQKMRQRLGLQTVNNQDLELIDSLIVSMGKHSVDSNRFLRLLSDYDPLTNQSKEALAQLQGTTYWLNDWLNAYTTRLAAEVASFPIRRQQMRAVNPNYLLRNYMAEEAIREAHQGNYTPVNELLKVLRQPFADQPEFSRFAGEPPEWAGGICLTCSS